MDMYKLPKEMEYCDMVLPGRSVRPEYIEQIKDLDILPDDVIIAAYPRSGTTWISEIVYLIATDGDFTTANKSAFHERVLFLERVHDISSKTDINHVAQKQPKRIFKTHLPLRFIKNQVFKQQAKTIVVMRNPKDMLVSLYHYYQSNGYLGFFEGSWQDFFKLVEANHLIYGNWVEHVTGYWDIEQQANVLVIFYEDMVKNTEGVIYKLASFMNKILSKELIAKIKEYAYFENMKKNPMVNGKTLVEMGIFKNELSFIRQGKVGGWKEYFTEEQNKFLEDNYIHRCDEVKLMFQYE